MIELLQNGKPVAQIPMPLPAADATGRIQQVGRLPIGELAPGNYELRAVVAQGTEQVVSLEHAEDRGVEPRLTRTTRICGSRLAD